MSFLNVLFWSIIAGMVIFTLAGIWDDWGRRIWNEKFMGREKKPRRDWLRK